jgi:hypothetical protein
VDRGSAHRWTACLPVHRANVPEGQRSLRCIPWRSLPPRKNTYLSVNSAARSWSLLAAAGFVLPHRLRQHSRPAARRARRCAGVRTAVSRGVRRRPRFGSCGNWFAESLVLAAGGTAQQAFATQRLWGARGPSRARGAVPIPTFPHCPADRAKRVLMFRDRRLRRVGALVVRDGAGMAGSRVSPRDGMSDDGKGTTAGDHGSASSVSSWRRRWRSPSFCCRAPG